MLDAYFLLPRFYSVPACNEYDWLFSFQDLLSAREVYKLLIFMNFSGWGEIRTLDFRIMRPTL
jgi:hypothetical protein